MIKLIFFHEKWCEHCKNLEPKLDFFRNQLKLDKVNIEYNPELAKSMGVTQIPTVVLFVNGEEKNRFVGDRTRTQIEKFLNGE